MEAFKLCSEMLAIRQVDLLSDSGFYLLVDTWSDKTFRIYMPDLANIPEVKALMEAVQLARNELYNVPTDAKVWCAIDKALAPFEDTEAT